MSFFSQMSWSKEALSAYFTVLLFASEMAKTRYKLGRNYAKFMVSTASVDVSVGLLAFAMKILTCKKEGRFTGREKLEDLTVWAGYPNQ